MPKNTHTFATTQMSINLPQTEGQLMGDVTSNTVKLVLLALTCDL